MSFFTDRPTRVDRPAEADGLVIIGRGAVGRALLAECGGCPQLVGRGMHIDQPVDHAIVTWPAQECEDRVILEKYYPELKGIPVTTLCNGVWVPPSFGAQGIAYVRAGGGGYRKPASWRVACPALAARLRACGADVTATKPGGHRAYLWGKALYLIPLALACSEPPVRTAREVGGTPRWKKYYDRVLEMAAAELGMSMMGAQVKRVAYLIERSPVGWDPSPSPEERDYFRRCLGYGEGPGTPPVLL